MATEYTPNYNLDLYVSKDKPNLRDQYNAAMRKIDAQLKTNAGNTVIATTAVGNLDRKVDGYDGRIAAVEQGLQVAEQGLQTVENTLANNTAPKDHASTDVIYGMGTTNLYGHVRLTDNPSTLSGSNGVAASPKLVNDAIQDALSGYTPSGDFAPTNHASTVATYGAGDATHYGHVRVIQDPNSSGYRLDDAAAVKYVNTEIERIQALESYWQIVVNLENEQVTVGTANLTFDMKVYVNKAIKMGIIQFHLERLTGGKEGGDITLATIPDGSHPLGSFGTTIVYEHVWNGTTNVARALNLLSSSSGVVLLHLTPATEDYDYGGNLRCEVPFRLA